MAGLMEIKVIGFVLCMMWGWSSHATLETKVELERTAIAYFLDNAHPVSGLVLDRAYNFRVNPIDNTVASIAATGFGLAVLSNAATRGLIDCGLAQDYVLRTLRFTRDHVARRKGWFLHFFDWSTGARVWNSEYSTIDTALFMAGALYAAQVYPGSEVAEITHQLYVDLDFNDPMTNGGQFPRKRTLSMAFSPESGYTPAEWNMYAEEMILILLGLGHPTQPLPLETWRAWNRDMAAIPSSPSSLMGLGQPLFVHQYSHLFVDFRGYDDGFQNYFLNSVEMTRYQREFIHTQQTYKTTREGFWGFSAGEAPGLNNYQAYSPLWHFGTVCIGCVAGSAMFLPTEILADANQWRNGPYGSKIWGKYGFIDSLDLDNDWFAEVVLGITVGPAYLSLANTEDQTSIWKQFMEIPEIQTAMKRAAQASPPLIYQGEARLLQVSGVTSGHNLKPAGLGSPLHGLVVKL